MMVSGVGWYHGVVPHAYGPLGRVAKTPRDEISKTVRRNNVTVVRSKVVNRFSFWLIGTSQLVPFC